MDCLKGNSSIIRYVKYAYQKRIGMKTVQDAVYSQLSIGFGFVHGKGKTVWLENGFKSNLHDTQGA